jgi:YbbR domain-containing protein
LAENNSIERNSPGRKNPFLNRRVLSFFVCVCLASLFWFLHALSKEYSITIRVPVKFSNFPEKRLIAVDLPDSVDVKVQGSGFTLFANQWMNSFGTLELDASHARSLGKGDFALPSFSHSDLFATSLGEGLQILKITPDTIVLSFEGRAEKSVPVHYRVTVQCAPSFRLGDSITTNPKTVTVSGAEALVNRINFVETENKNYSGLDKAVNEKVKLVLPPGLSQVTIIPDSVNLNIPVGKYTEGRFSIPVEPINVPSNIVVKPFPDKVDVVFLVSVEDYSSIHPDMFRLVLDYSKAIPGSNSLSVEFARQPVNLLNLRAEPQRVEYIIRK